MYKSAWVQAIKEDAGGYNDTFANYLTVNYGTGLEPEVLTEPKNSQLYYQKKFDLSEVLCVAYVTDETNPDISDVQKYKNKTAEFLIGATASNGWINPLEDHQELEDIPVISVNSVALPNVPLSGTTTPTGNLGEEWLVYINHLGYSNALTEDNFNLIYDH